MQQMQIKKAEIGLEDEMIKENQFTETPPGIHDFDSVKFTKNGIINPIRLNREHAMIHSLGKSTRLRYSFI